MSNGSDDKNKTIIGGALPGFQPSGSPAPIPGGPAPIPGGPAFRPAPPSSGQSTVIGGALPPGGSFGGGFAGGFGAAPPADPHGGDVWGSPSSPPAQPQSGGFGGSGNNPNPWGTLDDARAVPAPGHGAFAPSSSFFPDASPPPQQAFAPAQNKIDLRTALQARGSPAGAIRNPIISAASDLLILFGRLRTQMVAMEAVPLMEHVTREIEVFEAAILKAGVDPHQTQVAKYMLCATADDIVQNIPGTDRNLWIQYSMVARFFRVRTSGVGFFQEASKALAAPAQHADLLELTLLCLSLGFEGQYRSAPNGGAELQRIRAAIYESLRRMSPRPDEDISPHWQPVPLGTKRRFGGTPLWVIASGLGAIMLGAYLAFSTLLTAEGSELSTDLIGLHPKGQVSLLRTAAFVPAVPDPTPTAATSSQIERLQVGLAAELDGGAMEIGTRGDFIFVRINNSALFDSGQADVKAEFSVIALRIAEVLNAEQGPLRVLGFTDSVQLKGTGRFKNNVDLSVARAESVQKVLSGSVTDPSRITVEGRGEETPIGDNATAEGRAQNRRVEILIQREETL
jgi:type VI secretion system protein ImpK